MSGIMGKIIDQVTEDKAGHGWANPVWQAQQQANDQEKEAIKKRSEGDTDDRRHNQAGFYLRLVVVNTVEEIKNFFLPWRSR